MIARSTAVNFLALGLTVLTPCLIARSQAAAVSATTVSEPAQGQTSAADSAATTPSKPDVLVIGPKSKKGKAVYTGPTDVVTLPPTPMLDGEGKQLIDPDGSPMFNVAVRQKRDKKGHPVFDAANPVFQTATDLGYDEKGKKIAAKKVKSHKMTPVTISAGTLTVDGWTGKARLNYDIADVKFMYIYAPGIGTTIVSPNFFPGAKEQPGGFSDQVLKIVVDGHPIELSSEKQLLGKKPVAAWVMVDRSFALPTKFPVFGYGTTASAPYVWPGAKETVAMHGPVQAPPLPSDVRPALLLASCPIGMMRAAAPSGRPAQGRSEQPCVSISSHALVAPAAAGPTGAAASPSPGTER